MHLVSLLFSRCTLLLLLVMSSGCIYAETSLSAQNGPDDGGLNSPDDGEASDMGPLVDLPTGVDILPVNPDLGESDMGPGKPCDTVMCPTNQMCRGGECVCDPDSQGFDLAFVKKNRSFDSLPSDSPIQVIKHKIPSMNSHFAFVAHNSEVVLVGLLSETGTLVGNEPFSLDKAELAKALVGENDFTIEQVDLVPASNGFTLVVATSSQEGDNAKTLRLIGAKLMPKRGTDMMQWSDVQVYWQDSIKSNTFVAWDAAEVPGMPEQAPFLTFGIFGPNIRNPALNFYKGANEIAKASVLAAGSDETRVKSTWFVHGDLSTRKSEENVVQTFVFDPLNLTCDVVAFEYTSKPNKDGSGSLISYTSNPERRWLDHGIGNLPASLPLVRFQDAEAKVLGLLRAGAEPSSTIGLQTLTKPEGGAESSSFFLPLESDPQPLELLSASLPERAINASLPYPVAWAARATSGRTSQLHLARINPPLPAHKFERLLARL